MKASDLLACLHDCMALVGDVEITFVAESGECEIKVVDVRDEFKDHPRIVIS